jgi:hypothetical protein
MRELERLEAIRAIGLPADLFARVLPHEVELYRQRVAVQPLPTCAACPTRCASPGSLLSCTCAGAH